MRMVPRLLAGELRMAAHNFPIVILTGPRRAGKTTLLRHCFPRAAYHLLEDQDVIARVRSDPRGFLDGAGSPAILDEVQNTPEIFNYIRSRVDRSGGKACKWFLTGSQEAGLMKGVTESMAGRAAVMQLMPFSCRESARVSPFAGGYPEALARPRAADLWFRSYIQTYLERDVRAVTAVRDLATFRRFLAFLASRSGQVLNRTAMAVPLGVSIPTISEWIGILETTMQVILVQPFYENLGKRLIKSPKLYFADPGLLCHLLGIGSEAALASSVFAGPVFEGFVASEIAKAQLNGGKRREIYYFRDRPGLEVDFLVPGGPGRLVMLEAKASRTVKPSDAVPMMRLMPAMKGRKAEAFVVHWPSASGPDTAALAPGVHAVSFMSIGKILAGEAP
jgi:hypothetical protein